MFANICIAFNYMDHFYEIFKFFAYLIGIDRRCIVRHLHNREIHWFPHGMRDFFDVQRLNFVAEFCSLIYRCRSLNVIGCPVHRTRYPHVDSCASRSQYDLDGNAQCPHSVRTFSARKDPSAKAYPANYTRSVAIPYKLRVTMCERHCWLNGVRCNDRKLCTS